MYQADENYVWDLGINVVEVVVTAAPEGETFTPGIVFNGKIDGRGIKTVESGNPALGWSANVTFNGPNGDRGVKQIRAGFVQNLTVTKYQGMYANGRIATSSLQGRTFWDTKPINREKFYSANTGAFFQDADPASRKTKIISEFDSPSGGAPNTFQGSNLIKIDLIWDYDLYVVAVTTDIVATIAEVRRVGGADKGLYSATLTPIATVAGRLDPSAQAKAPVNLYVGSLSSSVKKAPPEGATVLVAVERNVRTGEAQAQTHWVDPNVCPFMPDDAGLVVLSGIDDRRIAETLERIRDARAGELPKSLRDALKPAAPTRPATGR